MTDQQTAILPRGPSSPSEEQLARRRLQRPKVERHGDAWTIRYWSDSWELDAHTGKPKRERVRKYIADATGPDKIGKRKAQSLVDKDHSPTINQQALRPSSSHTLDQFITEHFSKTYLPTLKPTGQAFYKSIIKAHIKPVLGGVKLRDLNVARVQGLIELRRQDKKSAQTLKHIRNCLSAILKEAKRLEWFAGELPTALVRLPEIRLATVKSLTKEQVQLLSDTLPEPTATLVIFLTVTGVRIGEACGLRWEHVHLGDDPYIELHEKYSLQSYEDSLKSGDGRIVPLVDDWVFPIVDRLKALRPAAADERAPVFASRNGTPIDQSNHAEDYLRPTAKLLKINLGHRKAWHAFRVCYSTLTDAAGLTVSERMKLLGHKSASMTARYTKPEVEGIRAKLSKSVQ